MNKQILEFKKLIVLPNGYIQGGFVQYNIDTVTGVISYQYELDAKVFFIPYNAVGNGTTKVDPSLLVSANLKVGQSIAIGPVMAVVASVADGKAICNLNISDAKDSITAAGQIVLNTSGEYLDILSVNEAGTVEGFTVTIQTA